MEVSLLQRITLRHIGICCFVCVLFNICYFRGREVLMLKEHEVIPANLLHFGDRGNEVEALMVLKEKEEGIAAEGVEDIVAEGVDGIVAAIVDQGMDEEPLMLREMEAIAAEEVEDIPAAAAIIIGDQEEVVVDEELLMLKEMEDIAAEGMECVRPETIAFMKNSSYHYANTKPFNHIVIDDFLTPECAKMFSSKVRSYGLENAPTKFVIRGNKNEYKKYAYQYPVLGRDIKSYYAEIYSARFLEALSVLTGISGIIVDPNLKGAGLHIIPQDGYLGMHTDFNMYDTRRYGTVDRRINVLLYLNEDWKEEYGGEVIISERTGYKKSRCVKRVLPHYNRVVLFTTSHDSIHGHPVPVSRKSPSWRRSLAAYFYTEQSGGDGESPIDFEGDSYHSTLWYPFEKKKCYGEAGPVV